MPFSTETDDIRDPSGSLRFSSKAVLTAKGVDFADGASFRINMDEMEVIGELGKGNYGSVQQVLHRPGNIMMAMKVGQHAVSLSRPIIRRNSDKGPQELR